MSRNTRKLLVAIGGSAVLSLSNMLIFSGSSALFCIVLSCVMSAIWSVVLSPIYDYYRWKLTKGSSKLSVACNIKPLGDSQVSKFIYDGWIVTEEPW